MEATVAPRRHDVGGSDWAIALAGAVGLTLVGGAWAMGARRRHEDDVADDPATPAPEARRETGPETASARSLASAFAATSPLRAPVLDGARRPDMTRRDALLETMVAAAPDEDNPFTTRKARLHRARMILAARDAAPALATTGGFDWRTYRPGATAPRGDTVTTPAEPAHV
jgi:hypothetical protein